jgi:hypothetical protein
MAPLLSSLLLALSLADAGVPAASSSRSGTILDVPYLPQTEALCGGAAAAMLFRYWGDTHADVQQFAPLVDREAGGIASDVLAEAVRARDWEAVPLQATMEILRERLEAGQPVILLIRDRPGRFHYVVAVGAHDGHVFVHDPTWGPARRYTEAELTRVWQPSGFWGLLVLPGGRESEVASRKSQVASRESQAALVAVTECDRLLAQAVDDIATRGLSSADEILESVRRRCPAHGGPPGELAGVRFSARRWQEAEELGLEAVALDPSLTYAWDVIGASRFVQNDQAGALEAWNRAGKPRIDSVRIEGLSRTRYALVAGALGLTPNTLLTSNAYQLAERRAQQLPSRLASRLSYRPQDDGYATVEVGLRERAMRPQGAWEWAARGVQTMTNREAHAAVPGWSGGGELWTASWRWWRERPRMAIGFATPRVGRLSGVWRVDAAWDAQTYRVGSAQVIREERVHGLIAVGNWITPHLRYEIAAGADSWDGRRRTLFFGGALERRFLDDRLAISARGARWFSFSAGEGFHSAAVHTTFRSRPEATGSVVTVRSGGEWTGVRAPLALWGGAGEGHARQPLLRAHPLLSGGIVAGPVFGPAMGFLNAEVQQWLEQSPVVRLGLAAFIDVASASRGLKETGRTRTHADAGIGLRVRLPGLEHTLRLDYGHGLQDGRHAVTVGVVRPF